MRKLKSYFCFALPGMTGNESLSQFKILLNEMVDMWQRKGDWEEKQKKV